MESEEAPSASDTALPSPVPMQHSTDRLHDSKLVNAVSTTEIMIADLCCAHSELANAVSTVVI
jgi:hypothetical protein